MFHLIIFEIMFFSLLLIPVKIIAILGIYNRMIMNNNKVKDFDYSKHDINY